MKFDARTLQILKSFSLINPSIHIKSGNVLSTISSTKTVMAKATLDTEIDEGFAIYDLSRFLGVLSLMEEPDLNLSDKVIKITGKNGDTINYTCADASNIVTPPDKDIKLPSEDVEFTMKEGDFSRVMKALSVLSLPEIAIVGDGKSVYLQAVDSKNPTADVYKTPVGETDRTFRVIFKSENLKIMPGEYRVVISAKGLSHFIGDKIQYWIAVENSSSFFDSTK